MRTFARDGHLCDSVSEAIIDDWLTSHHITHEHHVGYPHGNYKADWRLRDGTFVEYFGLAKDSPRYDRTIKEKENLCRELNLALIAVYPTDLYPRNRLAGKFAMMQQTAKVK